MEKNILISTLSQTKDLFQVSYYHFKDDLNRMTFCTGISNAEAGTKYMLSHYHIDQIIIVGPKGYFDYDRKTILIKSEEMPTVIEKGSVNELEFYCYRIAQFLSHIDIEANDIVFNCERERKKSLEKDAYRLFEKKQEDLFYTLAENDAVCQAYTEWVGANASEAESEILKYSLYAQMDGRHKMYPLTKNEDIALQYIGIDTLENGEVSPDSIFQILNENITDKKTHYNIYMDFQGMNTGDSITIWNLLTMYQKINATISLQSVICTQNRKNLFTGAIYDEKERYDLELLLSAIRSFVYYGKTEQFEDYYRKNNFSHQQLKNILVAMKYVDTGVSLNNIYDLTNGIRMLRILLNKDVSDMPPHERFVYDLLRNLLVEDYGRLLTSKEPELSELIAWTMKKGFVQQSLTMAEALIPLDMVKKGIYYYAQDDDDLEELKKHLNLCYWNDAVKNRFAYRDVEHFFVKLYGRSALAGIPKNRWNAAIAKLKIRLLHEKIEGMVKAYSNLNNDDMLYELLLNYYQIGDLRNDISHAIGTAQNFTDLSVIEENTRVDQVVKALTVFLGIYRSACKRVAKNKDAVTPRIISPDSFYSYVKKHKLYDLPLTENKELREQYVECEYNGNIINIRVRIRGIEDDVEDET